MKRYFFEIQTPFAPGGGWLRSPHGRDSWDQAFEEGKQYAQFAQDYRNLTCGVRVHVEG
jgi:hypothetical protein